MINNLVIVESPAKAKTIEKFLGKDFVVTSSFGHIRDLSKKNFGIDIENNYEPEYIVPDDKKNVVKELILKFVALFNLDAHYCIVIFIIISVCSLFSNNDSDSSVLLLLLNSELLHQSHDLL